jgi:hypothetical protein
MLIAIAIAPVFGEIQISNWEYSKYSNNNWLSENFSSGWSTGNSPFGTPSYFKVSTNADYKHIYVRKIISLNDSTEGLIKARAENNMKCYANGNLVAETHGNIQKGNQFYNCYSDFFSDSCSGGTAYHYDGYNDQNNFVYVDVSKYLKKGNNVIACEAWVDSKAYYHNYNTYYKDYIDGRLYLDFNFIILNSSAVLWSKTDKNFYKTEISTSVYRTFTCSSSYGCLNHNTYAVVGAEYWDGPWQWGDIPVSDGSYFKWTDRKCQPGGECNYIDPIWPYDSTNLYMRKWMWSDSNETKTLQISDTKLPECYVNGIKINLNSFNSPYWKYSADIQLIAGQNLIACNSPKIDVNSFDMRIVDKNGLLAIVSVDADSELKANEETTLTVTLANYSHPETDVALTLEVWGQTDYQQLLTETNSGTATFRFTPAESGNYDLLITALDLYDNDNASFASSLGVSVASNNQYGFLPISGSSDAKEGGGNLLVAALVATLGGAAAAGIYVAKGNSQGFSLLRIDKSLNRVSKAMNTLSYMANANAQANQDSFMATMAQRFNEFKAKFSAIEEEKAKIKQEEKERKARIARIEAENRQRQIAEMLKSIQEKPITWAEWYALQGMALPANRKNLSNTITNVSIENKKDISIWDLLGMIVSKVNTTKIAEGIAIGGLFTAIALIATAVFPPAGLIMLGIGVVGAAVYGYDLGYRIKDFNNDLTNKDYENASSIGATFIEDGAMAAGTIIPTGFALKYSFPAQTRAIIQNKNFVLMDGNEGIDMSLIKKNAVDYLSNLNGGMLKLNSLKSLPDTIYFDKNIQNSGITSPEDGIVIINPLNNYKEVSYTLLEEGFHNFQFQNPRIVPDYNKLALNVKQQYLDEYPIEQIGNEYQVDRVAMLWGGAKINVPSISNDISTITAGSASINNGLIIKDVNN